MGSNPIRSIENIYSEIIMARGVNKIVLMGNLTADPESAVNGKLAKLRLAVNGSKKNATTGQWEDVPMYIDVDVWNRSDTGGMASTALQYLRKGSQVHIIGRLDLEQWDDKTTGQKRSRHKVICDELTLVGGKRDDQATGDGQRAPAQQQRSQSQQEDGYGDAPPARTGSDDNSGAGSEIPFAWLIGTVALVANTMAMI